MPNRKLARLALLCLAMLTPLPSVAQFLWVEGTHYQRVTAAAPPNVPAGKIAVTEVFSYVCGGCFQARPEVDKLKAALPADAAMTYVHAGFNPSAGWPMFQRAFFTAQALGIADANHTRFFDSIWETREFPYVDSATGRLRQPLPTIADAARFYAKSGAVTEAAFLKKAASPEVDAAVKRAEELVRLWKVPSTPAFVVNGRYLINSESLSGWPQIGQLISYLVSLERARLKSAGSPAK